MMHALMAYNAGSMGSMSRCHLEDRHTAAPGCRMTVGVTRCMGVLLTFLKAASRSWSMILAVAMAWSLRYLRMMMRRLMPRISAFTTAATMTAGN